ncbi:carbohydrate esterase family 4 protein [Mucor lusitanicus]|uniref:Carbohydrate esterase family 4 protein n=2 Tax=Mucor circinelloides f. lusitanicus TaxID=29924 RepID=A0A162RI95_MUCCL|nr:carbohydrate esterase family 4 protein [Mucor lusitanicus]OAD06209.1 carbohydrate esterase family 4 protein [Mucor lusitanicus CBS 277.49]
MKLSFIGAALIAGQFVYAAPTSSTKTTDTATKTASYMPQHSPVFPSNMPVATGVVTAYNYGPYNLSTTLPTNTLSGYPDPWSSPSTKSSEVKAAIAAIDWSLVPDIEPRKQDSDGNWLKDSDGDKDPYCWWSSTNCVKPKIASLPEDYYTCGRQGDWGLSYDDGPFNLYTDENAATENPYAEPALYNFLAEHNNQKATLFYIGSNVATYPEAAKRAFNDGHEICVHTWSHPAMTTQTNYQTVAELYWTLKAIKEVTGVTPKCWRPPQGDVDDRIRSIAWQMGLRTVIWDEDSNDWDMPAPGGGSLPPSTVDGYFVQWLADQQAHNQTTGHMVLEHELNHATVNMTMKWLPILQKNFNVIPALACNNDSKPYWEEQFVYPLSHLPAAATSGVIPTAAATATASDVASATATSSTFDDSTLTADIVLTA